MSQGELTVEFGDDISGDEDMDAELSGPATGGSTPPPSVAAAMAAAQEAQDAAAAAVAAAVKKGELQSAAEAQREIFSKFK